MFVAILNDGSYDGDAYLLDWSRIPVSDEEVQTVTLAELVERRHDVIVTTPEMENDWEEFFGEENNHVKRAFILDSEIIQKIIDSTANAHIGGDGEAYAVNSALICIMEALAIRVVL